MLPPYDLPLWRYMYAARQSAEELAYQEHFLDNDIRQLAVTSYAVTLLLIAMTLIDLSRLAEEPVRIALHGPICHRSSTRPRQQ